jgi:uncharacterized RDD family membrane protein YckC
VYAGFWNRVGASGCDILLLAFILAQVQPYSGNYYPEVNVCICFIYYALSLALTSRTPGQRALGQKTVTLDEQNLTANLAIKRAVFMMFSYLLFGFPFLTILFSSKKQALHDILSNTVVVQSTKTRS